MSEDISCLECPPPKSYQTQKLTEKLLKTFCKFLAKSRSLLWNVFHISHELHCELLCEIIEIFSCLSPNPRECSALEDFHELD
uniref:Uncharacterized protein n=1 Tax=Lutzomyia longipalpis TaxID=7200 RepID=A0A1B0CHM7_LUTLO